MMFLILFLLILLIIYLSYFLLDWPNLFNKYFNKLEIECGMYSFLNKNCNSSLYLLFLIIFMIFDLEIILILMLTLKYINIMFMMFFIIIMKSLMLELFECSLKWND